MTWDQEPPRPRYYKLDGRRAVPCPDAVEWADWYETVEPAIATTAVGPLEVSTVFLGMDRILGSGAPQLFETMIFDAAGTPAAGYCRRYASWEEAEAGHGEAVEIARQVAAEEEGK